MPCGLNQRDRVCHSRAAGGCPHNFDQAHKMWRACAQICVIGCLVGKAEVLVAMIVLDVAILSTSAAISTMQSAPVAVMVKSARIETLAAGASPVPNNSAIAARRSGKHGAMRLRTLAKCQAACKFGSFQYQIGMVDRPEAGQMRSASKANAVWESRR
jgi:hypothetical protein